MKPKLFISHTSFLREDSEERINQLSKLGIDSNLTDDDIEWIPIKIPYDKITFSYPLDGGFKVGVVDAGSFFCKDDPFADDSSDDSYTIIT